MLKVRLQGTTYDIKWFVKLLSRDERFMISEPSEMLDNNGSLKYKRLYTEIYRDPEEYHRSRKKNSERKRYYGTGTVFIEERNNHKEKKYTAERRNKEWNVR